MHQAESELSPNGTTYYIILLTPLRASDYAYGAISCLKLAQGNHTIKRAGQTLCPNEGLCEPEKAEYNADTIALVATGIYFSEQCGIALPIFPQKVARPSIWVSKLSSISGSEALISQGIPADMPAAQTSAPSLARKLEIPEPGAIIADILKEAST